MMLLEQAAGKQARILNQMIDEFREHKFNEDRLKELLGHSFQVVVGSVLGVTISWLAGPAY